MMYKHHLPFVGSKTLGTFNKSLLAFPNFSTDDFHIHNLDLIEIAFSSDYYFFECTNSSLIFFYFEGKNILKI